VQDLTLEAEALDLRLGGMSYRAIAAAQGSRHPEVAHRRVQRALASIVPRDQVEHLRTIESERLEAVQERTLRALARVSAADDLNVDELCKLVAAAVRVSERMSKLH
jgi:hypothetical protein